MTPLEGMRLFPEFHAKSWAAWRKVLARLTPAVREFYAICGRGSGKSRIVGLLACAFAMRDYARVSGESIYIGVFAPDKKQAGVTFRYILGLLRSVPATAALIVTARRESVELSNGIIVEVLSSTIAAPRGRAYALAIVEEAAFLPQDQSANPDVELLRSLRPALARVKGSLLAVVSSPYARRGILWRAWQRHHAQPSDDVVLIQAATLDLNPTFDARAVEEAYEEDPESAKAEYGGQFRTDVETFLSPEAIAACVVTGRHELGYVAPPRGPAIYHAFTDPAGGSGGDSFTLAIGHVVQRKDRQPVAVIDCLREMRPPFSPEKTVAEFSRTLKAYDVVTVVGDHYAGEWPREAFASHGITYWTAEQAKSDLYRDALASLNSGRVALLDHPRLLAQLGGLERKTARSGRDSIDHAPGGHDDLANVVAGVVCEVMAHPQAGGVGHVLSDFDPHSPTGIEDAQREHVARQALARVRAELDPKRLTSQQWINQQHDERSKIGRVRVVDRSVTEDDDTSRARIDFDPFAGFDRGFDPYE